MKSKFLVTLFFAVGVLIGLDGRTARATLADYVTGANADATETFLATNVTPLPTSVNIGTLTGNNTYEFVANSISDTNGSEALLGDIYQSGGQAIKFEQWQYTGVYGATEYFVADYSYTAATTFGSNVFLDFVASSSAGKTELFVNGVDTGSSVPFAVSLSGVVTIGGTIANTNTSVDDFNGSITAVATYNSRLSASEILAHYNAFIAPVPTLSITQSNDVITVSWTATGSYSLLQTTNLSSGVWTTYTGGVRVDGPNNYSFQPAAGGNMFFRLLQP